MDSLIAINSLKMSLLLYLPLGEHSLFAVERQIELIHIEPSYPSNSTDHRIYNNLLLTKLQKA